MVAIHRNSARRGGKLLDVECCIVFKLKEGQIASGTERVYDLYAWDEFWS